MVRRNFNFGPREGKNNNLAWYMIGVFLPLEAVYLLVASSRGITDYITATFYVILTLIAVVALFMIKSDDHFYKNLSLKNLGFAIALSFAMTFFSIFLSNVSGRASMLNAVNSWGIVPQASSVVTLFIYTLLFGLVNAATAEELFRLPFFAEGQKRWGRGIKVNKALLTGLMLSGLFAILTWTFSGKILFVALSIVLAAALTIAFSRLSLFKGSVGLSGVVLFVGFPVGFWAAMHSISAYDSPLLILPAAVNGVLLTVYLWKTRCFLGCVFAHFLYNGFITTVTYINGTANIPSGTPLFPPLTNAAYWSNSGFAVDFLLLAGMAWGFLFFLLPSIRKDN